MSVHLLSVLPGHVKGGARLNCVGYHVSHLSQPTREREGWGRGTGTYGCRHASGEGQDGNEGLHDVVLKVLLIETNVERETTGRVDAVEKFWGVDALKE